MTSKPHATLRRWIPLTGLGLLALVAGSSFGQDSKTKPGLNIGRDSFVFDRLANLAQYGPGAEQRVDRDLQTVAQISRALSERGIKLTFVLVPMVQRIYEDRLPANYVLPKGAKNLYDHAMVVLKKSGVFAPNLNDPFLAARKAADATGFPLYMRQDNHWSSLGALEASKVLAAAMRSQYGPQLAAIPEVKSTVDLLPPVLYKGNYFEKLSNEDRASITQEKIRPIQYTSLSSGGLLDVGVPQIALAGTSFSYMKQFGFVNLLGHELERDVLNVAQSGKGEWTPLLDYLASDAFQATPPKIIVWEMPEEHLALGFPPVAWAGDWPRNQFLLETAANIRGDCGSAGKGVSAVTGTDFTFNATPTSNSASVASSGTGSFVKYQFAATIRNNQYLSVKVKSNSSDSFIVQGANESNQYLSKIGGFGVVHRVNVPLYTLADSSIRALTVRAAPGSDLSLEDAKLCAMPSELMSTLK